MSERPEEKRGSEAEGPEALEREEVEEMRFRVTCLNPRIDGAIPIAPETTYFPDGRTESAVIGKLCGGGHGMTVGEMNENLIWEGKPYIRIDYCKYCHTEGTVGIFTDQPQLLGWAILGPESGRENYQLEKLSEETHKKWLSRNAGETTESE